VEAAGYAPRVVLGSTLATLPLLEETEAALLARMAGTTLTTVIVRGEILCLYRCAEMACDAARLDARALLDEIYPVMAFHQDSWQENVRHVCLAGFGERFREFRAALEGELGCPVTALGAAAMLLGRLGSDGKALFDRQLDALVGWMMNRGA